MSLDSDPTLWKQVSGYLWAVLALPIATLWKKADGAVQKTDFDKYANSVKDVIKEHAANDEKNFDRQRETMIKIFEKLEQQGRGIQNIETTLTFLRGRDGDHR